MTSGVRPRVLADGIAEIYIVTCIARSRQDSGLFGIYVTEEIARRAVLTDNPGRRFGIWHTGHDWHTVMKPTKGGPVYIIERYAEGVV